MLQVKLAYQESELVTLLKKIPLGQTELNILREKAEQLKEGKLRSRGEALLPLTLASFIFDLFCLPGKLLFNYCCTVIHFHFYFFHIHFSPFLFIFILPFLLSLIFFSFLLACIFFFTWKGKYTLVLCFPFLLSWNFIFIFSKSCLW